MVNGKILMGARRRIKAKIEAAADKAREALTEVHAGGVEAQIALAKFTALVDVAAEILDDLAERGLHVELTWRDEVIPIGLKATIPAEDSEG